MSQLLKKIALRTVFGSKGEILELVMKDKDKDHPLMRVVGFATGARTAKSREAGDDGEKIESTGLVGEIEATNLVTGEVFASAVAWLPQMATDLALGQLGGDVDRVGFAYDIGAKYSEKAATSYEFTVKPLMEMKPSDAMAELKAALPAAPDVKALPSSSKKK